MTGFGFNCLTDIAADGTSVYEAIAGGLGPTNPPVPTGQAAPGSVLTQTIAKPVILIFGPGGTAQAEVLASVLVNWFPGTYQVNFRVPPSLPDGKYSAILTIGGASSNATSIDIATHLTNISLAGSSYVFKQREGAPESLMKATRCGGLATTSELGDPTSPALILAGTSARVTDSAGFDRPLRLLSASPAEVDYVLPKGLATGPATVTITASDGKSFTGPVNIQNVAPNLFLSEDYTGDSIPLALVVRTHDGVQTQQRLELAGIDLGPASDQVSLVLFATGLRGRSSLANVSLKIGGVDAPVDYAGPQGQFAGVDQVNVRLPRSLAGKGLVTVELTVDGKAADGTSLTVQ
jgi:uncharacterized protein (TIGR03437 family)